MPWGPDVETNLAISSANHLKVRFIQQSRFIQTNKMPINNNCYIFLFIIKSKLNIYNYLNIFF
ncbi:hypothetical protein E3U36_07645 [Arsenophonus endosymbiont of Aphis craccivora]|uniref:hypothetical protein n=1 Tax=Arsenophonus endosymbiont of Aphis craccivora TaxID=1231049 RepID=UPI0015DD253F|nr:hypothetical protein [Arsenophonus endosymbiont of Aphis craccivora]QLK87986.1 hypothetical protein E3U36_07645 [Arsenophonus endosymbiont of Aphis craccivora]